MGLILLSFFWSAISLSPNKVSLTDSGSSPFRRILIKSVRAVFSFSWGTPVKMSLRRCAVSPSGPSDDRAGKVIRHLVTSSEETCNGWNIAFQENSPRGLWSGGAGGCLDEWLQCCWVVWGWFALVQSKWIAARKLSASNLFVTVAARWESCFLLDTIREGHVGLECKVGVSLQSQSLLKTMFACFFFTASRAGLARIDGPNASRFSQVLIFIESPIIFRRMLVNVTAQVARAAFGTLAISSVHGGCSRLWGYPLSSLSWLAEWFCDRWELIPLSCVWDEVSVSGMTSVGTVLADEGSL